MKLLLQILFFILSWFASNATSAFTKAVLPSYDSDSYRNSFSKIENVKEESVIKIVENNFADDLQGFVPFSN